MPDLRETLKKAAANATAEILNFIVLVLVGLSTRNLRFCRIDLLFRIVFSTLCFADLPNRDDGDYSNFITSSAMSSGVKR